MNAMMKISSKVLIYSLTFFLLTFSQLVSFGNAATQTGDEGAAKLIEGAQKEGQVVWYTTTGIEIAHKMVAKFKERYPKIDAKIYRANDAPLMERILGEDRAGKYVWDVMTTTGYYIRVLKQKGMLEAYDSPQRKYYQESFKDPQKTWTSYYTNYAVIGYNTKTVPSWSKRWGSRTSGLLEDIRSPWFCTQPSSQICRECVSKRLLTSSRSAA